MKKKLLYKATVKRLKGQVTDRKKLLVNNISDNGLVSKKTQRFSKLSNKTTQGKIAHRFEETLY